MSTLFFIGLAIVAAYGAYHLGYIRGMSHVNSAWKYTNEILREQLTEGKIQATIKVPNEALCIAQELLREIQAGHLASIGAMSNTYTPQISRQHVDKWAARLSAATLEAAETEHRLMILQDQCEMSRQWIFSKPLWRR